MAVLPESPRHLLYQGKIEEGKKVIALLNDTTPDSELTEDIVLELQEGLQAENAGGKATWLECFAPGVVQRTIIGMMLQTFQQFNGQNFYYYYGDTFFESSGTGLSSYEVQVVLGGVSFAMIFPALYLMGRRKSLVRQDYFTATTSCTARTDVFVSAADHRSPRRSAVRDDLCAGGALPPRARRHARRPAHAPERAGRQGPHRVRLHPGRSRCPHRNEAEKVLTHSWVLQVSLFSLMWGPTPWVYLGESFPMRVRAKCISLGAAANWFWNFLTG